MFKNARFRLLVTLTLFGIFGFAVVLIGNEKITEAKTVLSQETQIATTPAAHSISKPKPGIPARIIVPAIDLNSSVLSLGTDAKGNMDVPSGKTNDVGWFKYGTIPGNTGTAVLDAHVFAAFSKLNELKNGDDIFILTTENSLLHFKVKRSRTYALNSLSSAMLFGSNGTKKLNLITCAGMLTSDHSTYTQRLIVSAQLVGA